MKLNLTFLLALIMFVNCSATNEKSSAKQVIFNYVGKEIPIKLKTNLEKQNGCDVYETSVENGVLTIKGSSGVALCRGFYSFIKEKGMGINSWSGNRFNWPDILPDEAPKRVVSPFKNHYYFNVVTFGYTTAYWDWERWSREIDWMALHGLDMPLALVANEAISARVWKKLGLTDKEIDNYFVGPAHFPWMRMGNISGIDGPLPQEWHADQIALQHKILDKMKSLGMRPICPGFAGFVPKEMTRIYPDLKLFETSWSGGAFHNWMVSPEQPLFKEIGKMFIEEWEKEFGKNEYYIVDSFNEMDIPFPPKGTPERYTLLAGYGEKVYESIKAGNPNAVWVMQGWMFGYQRHIWDYETLQALVSKVPNDKMILLDLAADYNALFWKNTPNWEFYKGLYGKEWVYSVIPNMGGKVGMTGDLEFYANGRLKALNSPNKGNLTGYGMAPEGIENNEVIYELITDAGWHSNQIDLNLWLKNYSINRYGSAPDSIMNYWNKMRESVYGSFTDHPRYNWQFRPASVMKGSIKANQSFFEGIESFIAVQETLKDSPLYNVDLIELTAQYTGAKLEILIRNIIKAYTDKKADKAKELEQQFESIALDMDRILSSHPNLRLENWIGYARKHGSTDSLKNYYEKNARRLVTIWGPPVDDYSARIWSGLIRDYYLPRWKHYFNEKSSGEKFDYAAWERDWVENKLGLLEVKPYENVREACVELINKVKGINEVIEVKK